MTDAVEKRFCRSFDAILIQCRSRTRNIDSRNRSLRFDCCESAVGRGLFRQHRTHSGHNDGHGSGFYHDAAAVSASFTHRFNSTMPLYFSAGYSNGGGTEHVGRAAVTVVW